MAPQVLTFKTDLKHDHRNESGFRCDGSTDIVLREDTDQGGIPVVDAVCAKCQVVQHLGVTSVEFADQEAARLARANLAPNSEQERTAAPVVNIGDKNGAASAGNAAGAGSALQPKTDATD